MIYDSRDQLFAAGGIATETTAATFVASASNKEVRLFQADGQAAAGAGDTFFAAYKDGNGTPITSAMIGASDVISYKKTSPKTAVPSYASFAVDVTGLADGDLLNVFARVYGLGTGSSMDQYEKTVVATFESGDTSATLAAKMGVLLYQNWASDYTTTGRGTTTYNKAGYAAIYTTETAALAAVGDLSDTNLVWVIANAKPYTFAASGATFASNFTEKTDWSTELAASPATAVVVPAVKYYDFVQIDDTNDSLYICAKAVTQDDERFSGRSSITNVSATTYDVSNSYAKSDFTVTHVFEVVNPCSGKLLRNKEVSLDYNQRPYGRFEILGENPVLNIDTSTDYYVVDIVYNIRDFNTNNQLVKTKGKYQMTIACTASADADTIITQLGVIKNGETLSLGDLSDVDLSTPGTDGQVLGTDGTTWTPADDATA